MKDIIQDVQRDIQFLLSIIDTLSESLSDLYELEPEDLQRITDIRYEWEDQKDQDYRSVNN